MIKSENYIIELIPEFNFIPTSSVSMPYYGEFIGE